MCSRGSHCLRFSFRPDAMHMFCWLASQHATLPGIYLHQSIWQWQARLSGGGRASDERTDILICDCLQFKASHWIDAVQRWSSPRAVAPLVFAQRFRCVMQRAKSSRRRSGIWLSACSRGCAPAPQGRARHPGVHKNMWNGLDGRRRTVFICRRSEPAGARLPLCYS